MVTVPRKRDPAIKVLHLITHLEPGGIETWLLAMVGEIDRARCAMDICCKGAELGSLADQARSAGARVHHCRLRPTHVGFVSGLLRLLKNGNYDLVHSHLGTYSGLAVKLAHLAGLPAIATFHSARFPAQTWTRAPVVRQLRGLYSRLGVAYAISRAEKVTATSKSILRELNPGFESDARFALIRLGANLPTEPSATDKRRFREQLAIPDSAPILIHVGNFRPAKNHSALLEVLSKVLKQRPDAVLILVGDGDLRPVVRQAIHDLGLGDAARLMGRQPEALRLMSMSDILLMPSLNEGFGLAAVEAGAAGLPVVASNVGGLTEAVVDGETGFLFSPADTTAMANKIVGLLSDPDRAKEIGERGRERATRLFSLQGSAERLLELYDDCLRDHDSIRVNA